MLLHRATSLFRGAKIVLRDNATKVISKPFLRSSITTPSGAILPEPKRTPFSFLGVVSSIVFGLLVGATISKNIANFLEENDLFVPSDDDDDDDD
ncbi:essential MCU regulator, mitochondrial [Linepithema humile]|uniref:essential MCU regulator, mitochondrial n=1 Tax=Linepithema humile TaxID=83485 RepID=UPI0006233EC0|nr:PREDICTED: protein EMRE homolog, mitochondrial [Linepithema humile]